MPIFVENENLVKAILDCENLDLNAKVSAVNTIPHSLFKIQCDYCKTSLENCSKIPEGWFTVIFKENDEKRETNTYQRGPVLCPKHFSDLKMCINYE